MEKRKNKNKIKLKRNANHWRAKGERERGRGSEADPPRPPMDANAARKATIASSSLSLSLAPSRLADLVIDPLQPRPRGHCLCLCLRSAKRVDYFVVLSIWHFVFFLPSPMSPSMATMTLTLGTSSHPLAPWGPNKNAAKVSHAKRMKAKLSSTIAYTYYVDLARAAYT